MHVTSSWARIHGLADPAVAAAAVRAAAVTVAPLRQVCRQAIDGVDRADPAVRHALRRLTRGWSTTAPRTVTQGLGECGDRMREYAAGLDEAVAAFAHAAAAAAAAVSARYRAVDADIAAGYPLPISFVSTPADDLLRERQRRAVVMALTTDTARAREEVDAAARQLLAAAAIDPRSLLPRRVAAAAGRDRQAEASAHDAHARTRLARDLADPDPTRRAFAAAVRADLERVERTGAEVHLLAYDAQASGGQGGVAVALGDLATADAVAVVVPGVGNSPSDLGSMLAHAGDLRAKMEARGGSAATIAWLDYDIPLSTPKDVTVAADDRIHALADALRALDDAGARIGGQRLAKFARSLREVMGPAAALTLAGHSYGSTVVSHAAAAMEPDVVDEVVLMASPGAGRTVTDASGYTAVAPGHVYSLAATGDVITDPLTDSAAAAAAGIVSAVLRRPHGAGPQPFGPDPNAPAFGATRIDGGWPAPEPGRGRESPAERADARRDHRGIGDLVADVRAGIGAHGMANYLSGPSLSAVAAVATGHYAELATRGSGR